MKDSPSSAQAPFMSVDNWWVVDAKMFRFPQGVVVGDRKDGWRLRLRLVRQTLPRVGWIFNRDGWRQQYRLRYIFVIHRLLTDLILTQYSLLSLSPICLGWRNFYRSTVTEFPFIRDRRPGRYSGGDHRVTARTASVSSGNENSISGGPKNRVKGDFSFLADRRIQKTR